MRVFDESVEEVAWTSLNLVRFVIGYFLIRDAEYDVRKYVCHKMEPNDNSEELDLMVMIDRT
jgi:hypothetical protein